VRQQSRPVPTHERPPASTVSAAARVGAVPQAPAR
jgi:hypothetical protein